MNKVLTPLWLSLFLSLILSGCNDGDVTPFLGKWKAENVEADIRKEEKQIIVKVKNQGGMLGGTFSAKMKGDQLRVQSPLIGEVAHVKKTDSLLLGGAELIRYDPNNDPFETCQEKLAKIDYAKEAYGLDFNLSTGATITMTNLLQPTRVGYLKVEPTCPSGGQYSVNVLGDDPTCTNAHLGHVLE